MDDIAESAHETAIKFGEMIDHIIFQSFKNNEVIMGNRKPFNVERALAGDPVVDNKGNEYVKFRTNRLEDEIILGLRKDGRVDEFDLEGNNLENMNLFMAPKTTTYYVNVYKDGNDFRMGIPSENKDHADDFNDRKDYLKTISFEINEEPKKEKKKLWIGIFKHTHDGIHHTTNAYPEEERFDRMLEMYSYKPIKKEIEVEV